MPAAVTVTAMVNVAITVTVSVPVTMTVTLADSDGDSDNGNDVSNGDGDSNVVAAVINDDDSEDDNADDDIPCQPSWNLLVSIGHNSNQDKILCYRNGQLLALKLLDTCFSSRSHYEFSHQTHTRLNTKRKM